MSWLSGLAGKAEDLLNKIDHNAAIALQKGPGPQFAVGDVLMEVTSGKDETSLKRTAVMNTNTSRQDAAKSVTTVKSYPILASSCGPNIAKDTKKDQIADDDLMEFLNSPKSDSQTPKKIESLSYSRIGNVGMSLSPRKALPANTSTSKRSLEVEVDSALQQVKEEVSVDVLDGRRLNAHSENDQFVGIVAEENAALHSQLQTTEQEASITKRKLKESLQEIESLKGRLASMDAQLKEVQGMYSHAIEDSKKIAEAAIAERFQAQSELDRMKNEFSYSMDDKTHALEIVKAKMEAELVATNNKASSLQRRYDSLVEELRNNRLEQERYRARAQAVLAARDREIADLRAGSGLGQHADSAVTEYQKFESEKERQMWEEEVLRLREEAERLRLALDEARRQWEQEREEVEDEVVMERGRREAAEEEARAVVQELRSVKAELERQRHVESELQQKVSKMMPVTRREEAQEVRNGWRSNTGGGGTDLVVHGTIEDGISDRLAALTSTLVEKQIRVESLTAERNALRLQLEKTDHLYRDAVAHLGQGSNSAMPGQNDTDDVKARIPSFLLESPFDTAVARKVKRAYSTLDSIGVRVGIFLRRYPLARTLLLLYTVMLHLWVVVVLLTYTPDVH